MAWPTGQQVDTTNLDNGADNPALARIDLYQALVYLNQIIASQNQEFGAVVTDGTNKISGSQIPNVIQMGGSISLEPTGKRINIKNFLNLNALTTAQLNALTIDFFLGDVVLISDADSGSPAVCFYDGTDWKKLPLSGLSVL
jgi:hypothetical protein